MADIRTGAAGSSLVPQSTPSAGRSVAAKAAQRAFFEAALAGTSAVTAPVAPRVSPIAPAQPARTDASTPPTRLLRPGSLLDIKV